MILRIFERLKDTFFCLIYIFWIFFKKLEKNWIILWMLVELYNPTNTQPTMSATASENNNKYAHIYYDDWKPGSSYERRITDGKVIKVIQLGKLVSKTLSGRTYDPDIVLIFEGLNGTQHQHVVEFDSSYRCIS